MEMLDSDVENVYLILHSDRVNEFVLNDLRRLLCFDLRKDVRLSSGTILERTLPTFHYSLLRLVMDLLFVRAQRHCSKVSLCGFVLLVSCSVVLQEARGESLVFVVKDAEGRSILLSSVELRILFLFNCLFLNLFQLFQLFPFLLYLLNRTEIHMLELLRKLGHDVNLA